VVARTGLRVRPGRNLPRGGLIVNRELTVDWIACEAFGMCHDLAPDLVALDDWGYPILPDTAVASDRAADIQRIVDCCPARALRLMPHDVHRGRGVAGRGAGNGAARHRWIRSRA